MVLTFFERQREDAASPEWLARQRRKIEGGVREMARLVAGRTFAVGDQFGLGDIAVGTAMGYLRVRFGRIRLDAESTPRSTPTANASTPARRSRPRAISAGDH